MTPEAYFTGDSVPLEFNVFYKEVAEPVSSALVVIRNPHNELTEPVSATVDGDIVSYAVPGTETAHEGEHRAYFVCIFPYGERTHEIIFDVLPNPRWK